MVYLFWRVANQNLGQSYFTSQQVFTHTPPRQRTALWHWHSCSTGFQLHRWMDWLARRSSSSERRRATCLTVIDSNKFNRHVTHVTCISQPVRTITVIVCKKSSCASWHCLASVQSLRVSMRCLALVETLKTDPWGLTSLSLAYKLDTPHKTKRIGPASDTPHQLTTVI